MFTPLLTPEGFLFHEGESVSSYEKKLVLSESPSALFTLLATQLLTAEMEPSWRWLRDFAMQFFARLCQTKEALSTAVPSVQDREAFIALVPPFPGVEYLNSEII